MKIKTIRITVEIELNEDDQNFFEAYNEAHETGFNEIFQTAVEEKLAEIKAENEEAYKEVFEAVQD